MKPWLRLKKIEATKLLTIPNNKRLQELLHMTDWLHSHSKKSFFFIFQTWLSSQFFIQSFKILYQLLPCAVMILNNSLLKIKKSKSSDSQTCKKIVYYSVTAVFIVMSPYTINKPLCLRLIFGSQKVLWLANRNNVLKGRKGTFSV